MDVINLLVLLRLLPFKHASLSLQLMFHTRRSALLSVDSAPLNHSLSLNVATCVHALFEQKRLHVVSLHMLVSSAQGK